MSAVFAHAPQWALYDVVPYQKTWRAASGDRRDEPPTIVAAIASAREPALAASHLHIDRLAELEDDWDGYGSTKPSRRVVEGARQFLDEAFYTASGEWQTPHLSASEEGEIAFEWWNGRKKLTIYIGESKATYLKSWGPNLVTEMDDGEFEPGLFPNLWMWLFA